MRDFQQAASNPKVQVEIDGLMMDYDACDSRSLEIAKAEYEPKGFRYIGSSKVWFFGNVKQVEKSDFHYFVNLKKSNQ